MSVPELEGRRRQHIRHIGHHFLSGSERSATPAPRPARRCDVIVGGSPGSRWLLPFAVNLALAAADEGEGTILALPASRLPMAARLLGADSLHMGLTLTGDEQAKVLRPQPNLYLVPEELVGLAAEHPGQRWLFQLGAECTGPAVWIYLEDDDGRRVFSDPRTDPRDPIFILGRDRQPTPRREAGGIWGRLPSELLLCTERASWPALFAGTALAKRQYRGYLQALKRVSASHARGDALRMLPGGGGR